MLAGYVDRSKVLTNFHQWEWEGNDCSLLLLLMSENLVLLHTSIK